MLSVADGTLNMPQLIRPALIRLSNGSVLDATRRPTNRPTLVRAALFSTRIITFLGRVGST